MATLTYTGTLIITSCWCGIKLAIPGSLYDEAHRKKTDVFCPLGHRFIYRTDTTEKELEAERQRRIRVEARLAQTEDRLDVAKRQRAAARGQVTKIRNRVKNGVCPFCNRHFVNVERHMTTQHAEVPVDER